MEKANNPTPQRDGDTQSSSELYNRPGSTEHNDYRISGNKEGVASGKKTGRDKAEDTFPGEEKGNSV